MWVYFLLEMIVRAHTTLSFFSLALPGLCVDFCAEGILFPLSNGGYGLSAPAGYRPGRRAAC